MKIVDVIEMLEKEGIWINWQRSTRDRVLYGDPNQKITRIGVCWVATIQVIEEALRQNINFIISHENIFYTSGTSLETKIIEAVDRKKQLLDQGNICVYRSHDVWDSLQNYGVSDMWAKRLGFKFAPRVLDSYYQYADIETMSAAQLAKHVAGCVKQDGEEGVYLFGDEKKLIHRIAIGTGAGTNIFDMLSFEPDAMIVSDDGITNFKDAQYAIDNHMPLIVVNHAGCEICGLKQMVYFLKEKYPEMDTVYLEEGFTIKYYLG